MKGNKISIVYKVSILSRNYDTEWIKVQKERKTTLRHKCEDLKKENSSFDSLEKLLIPFNRYKLANLLVDEEHKLLYCYIPKDLEVREMLETYKKFMIVRHPTERLLSAYKDKFLSNSPDAKVFKRVYAVPMMRYSRNTSKNIPLTGNGMKFTEFLSYILSQNPQTLQEHWKSYFHLCHPCAMDYDFVGKYETLEADSNQILKNINAPPDLRFPPFKKSKTGEQLKQGTSTLRFSCN
ncbi:Carbohydrate sulfotransferase 14 [Armadillidium vulgare]|nr:Carbohydrate sulfotransferase 14 [Armadillidium vulgare]